MPFCFVTEFPSDLIHLPAFKLLIRRRLTCAVSFRKCDRVNAFAQVLFCADKEGNAGFGFQVSIANPEIMPTGDSSFRNIFCYAVDYHQARVFSLIHGLCFKDVVATSKDIHGNALLRMAATQSAALLNRIYRTTLQMQRELQWFKEVERIIPPTIRVARYIDNLAIEELFRKSHKELLKEGEK